MPSRHAGPNLAICARRLRGSLSRFLRRMTSPLTVYLLNPLSLGVHKAFFSETQELQCLMPTSPAQHREVMCLLCSQKYITTYLTRFRHYLEKFRKFAGALCLRLGAYGKGAGPQQLHCIQKLETPNQTL